MDIRFLKQHGIHSPDKVVYGFHPGAAAELLRRGIAEAVGQGERARLDTVTQHLGDVPVSRGRKGRGGRG